MRDPYNAPCEFNAHLIVIDTNNRLGIYGGNLVVNFLEGERHEFFEYGRLALELGPLERHAALVRVNVRQRGPIV